MSIGRLVTFVVGGSDGVKWSKEMREQLKTMQRDVASLTDHASYLSNKITFVLDAMLGSSTSSRTHHQAVLGDGGGLDAADADRLDLRHELQDMPELESARLSVALLPMVVAAVLPYVFFKWKRWL